MTFMRTRAYGKYWYRVTNLVAIAALFDDFLLGLLGIAAAPFLELGSLSFLGSELLGLLLFLDQRRLLQLPLELLVRCVVIRRLLVYVFVLYASDQHISLTTHVHFKVF